jgi:hypothetical protein
MNDKPTGPATRAADVKITECIRRATEALIDRSDAYDPEELIARATVAAALDVEKTGRELEQIGAIDKNRPADAGPWVNAPLSVVVAHLLGPHDTETK